MQNLPYVTQRNNNVGAKFAHKLKKLKKKVHLDFVGKCTCLGRKPKPNMCSDRQLYDADKRGVVVGRETRQKKKKKKNSECCFTNGEKGREKWKRRQKHQVTHLWKHSSVWRVARCPGNYNALGGWEVQRCGGGWGKVPSSPALPRLGRVRKARAKLEELPTLWERTQEKAQREDKELHRFWDVWRRTLRKFCEDLRRGESFFFFFLLLFTRRKPQISVLDKYLSIFTHGRKSVLQQTSLRCETGGNHNILRYYFCVSYI